jgi:ribosome recycling factor
MKGQGLDMAALRKRMDGALEALRKELQGLRTGRASTNLLEPITVEAYGAEMPLNQVATVSSPEPRLLIVTPFDKGQTKAIEKAIRESDLGVEPSTQGPIIRVPLPALSEQRRKELIKVVHKYAEEGRIAVRHARTHGRDLLKKVDGVSEDDKKHAEKELQKFHDDAIKKIEDMIKAKEAEIMEV